MTWLRRPGRGPHELRLLGLTEARGNVVAITEDHRDVAPDWCEQVIAAHERCPGAVAVAGPVTNGADTNVADRASFLLVHVLAGVATAGYLVGITGPGGSLRRLR